MKIPVEAQIRGIKKALQNPQDARRLQSRHAQTPREARSRTV